MVGAAADVGHAGEFGLRDLAAQRRVELFGYPGLVDPGLVTETSFDVAKLLSNHTRLRYRGVNGVNLPETYNGLGARNLVYMLLQILRFFREFQGTTTAAGVHQIGTASWRVSGC